MEQDQIIKSLECCISSNGISACESGCPLFNMEPCPCLDDSDALLNYALSLIKQLIEENAILKKNSEAL